MQIHAESKGKVALDDTLWADTCKRSHGNQ